MGWMQKLYETYERCAGAPQFDKSPLLPINHTQQQAHIEIVLDENGAFQRAEVLNRENTVIPATEDSAGGFQHETGRQHRPRGAWRKDRHDDYAVRLDF